MSKPRLHAIGPDDTPKRARNTVLQASVQGDRLAELEAMRLVIAKAIDNPKTLARDLSSLSRRLLEIGKEVEALEGEREEEALAYVEPENEEWSAI